MGPRDKVVGAESELRKGVPHYENLNPGSWNPEGVAREKVSGTFPLSMMRAGSLAGSPEPGEPETILGVAGTKT